MSSTLGWQPRAKRGRRPAKSGRRLFATGVALAGAMDKHPRPYRPMP